VTVTDDGDEPLDPVSQWEEEVGAVYDLVSAGPRVVFQEAGFVPVEPEMVSRIQAEAGLTVTGCLHIMDTDSVRHIIKRHGNQEEALRGQVSLVREDFLLLPTVFSDPETVENSGKTKQGRDTVRYSKAIGDFRYHYTEELRTKKNRLAAVTFYKRKN
jgi:hypothetical protein